MSIAYDCGTGLYLNITNICPCKCIFCIRNKADSVGSADSLWLTHEPDLAEILAELDTVDFQAYDEVVFCGYGEPLARLDVLLAVCDYLREKTDLPIRINTNGLANLIHKRQVIDLLVGKVDSLSISLNAPNNQRYQEVSQPSFKEKAFPAMLAFAEYAKGKIADVTMTVVDIIRPDEIEECRKIATNLGITFRVRSYF